jgi:hypothetical protein
MNDVDDLGIPRGVRIFPVAIERIGLTTDLEQTADWIVAWFDLEK